MYIYIRLDEAGKALRVPNDASRVDEAAVVDYKPGPLGYLFQLRDSLAYWANEIASKYGVRPYNEFDLRAD
jgi:hypothetical protein